ncbi:MAG: IS30 family transposase [Patescibacteria group bacterium]
MKNKKFVHIKNTERLQIAFLQEKKYSLRSIATMLGRSPNTISSEVKENAIRGIYDPKKADHKAYVKRLNSKYQGMKVVDNYELRNYIEEKIRDDWSPEQISGRIKYVDTHINYISCKGVYKFVWSVYGRWLEPFLRYGRKKRHLLNSTKKAPLENRTFIDQRPKIVGKRSRFGDWEGDFIVSGKSGSGALLVLVERKSRYVLIFKLKDRKVVTINAVLRKVFGAGQIIASSLTIDNDICFRHHVQMSSIIGAPIFFCHPYHSWEKGGVENMNGLIRQYVKKSSDISLLSEEYIQEVERKLQTRPRKCLRYKTPLEVMTENNQLTFIKKWSIIKQKTPSWVS